MPHCDMELYENVLRKNWTRERLTNLVLVSNQLEAYVEKYVCCSLISYWFSPFSQQPGS